MHIDQFERTWINAVVVVLGIFFASLIAGAALFGVRTPESGGFLNPQEIMDSEFASPGVRHMGGNRYEARILAQKWNFTPSEIRVPVGAEVTFIITSRDITHGFLIEDHNANLEIIPGHIGRVHATFNEEGTYHFLCHEYCGRLHQAMYGKIIVEDGEAVAAN